MPYSENAEKYFNTVVGTEVPVDTHPIFSRVGEDKRMSGDGFASIRVFRQAKGYWGEYSFPATQDVIRIGSSPDTSNILIKDRALSGVQVVLRRTTEAWYVFEAGDQNLTVINGVKRKQAVISRKETCTLTIGAHRFLITGNKEDSEESPPVAGESRFTLNADGVDYHFPTRKTILIGGSSLCNLKIGEEDFSALILNLDNQFYLHPVSEVPDDDGFSDDIRAYPLSSGSQFFIYNHRFTVSFPAGAMSSGFKLMRKFSVPRLVLMELDDNGNVTNRLMLPQKGRSIFAGREKGNYFVFDSAKISRRHAQIMTNKNSVFIIDCGSTNGSHINDEKISRKIARPGDLVRFGDREFILGYSE